jgi:outer membrane autotransporter protein
MGLFLNAMIDPFVIGRDGGLGGGMGYAAPAAPSRVQAAAQDAFAAALPVKAPLAPIAEQRWTTWASGFGGRSRIDGDPVIGSQNLRASAGGFAMGVDYRLARDTVVGVAAAIGETRWDIPLGNGDADVAQVGAYASTRWQNFYLSGAAAAAWFRADTKRIIAVNGVDRLQAGFDADGLSGRLEGGYRFGAMPFGLTPYGALQVFSVRSPTYTEVAVGGSNQFALTYAGQTTTDTRSELGVWADARHMLTDRTQFIARGRIAWVHDFDPGSRINAAFQTLPAASFTVNGATPPRDSALASAVAEFRMPRGITLIGKVDGEFAHRAHTFSGTGTLRYAW